MINHSFCNKRLQFGPIVYRLGHVVFILERGVRFPLGPPNLPMKFLRVGDINHEKPAAIEGDGTIRDLSSIINDFNPQTLNFNIFNKLRKVNLSLLPKIAHVNRAVSYTHLTLPTKA